MGVDNYHHCTSYQPLTRTGVLGCDVRHAIGKALELMPEAVRIARVIQSPSRMWCLMFEIIIIIALSISLLTDE